jgi:hypothetical protein
MTRLSVPVESRLRYPKNCYGYGVRRDKDTRRIMVIALTALYTGDMAEQVRIYNQYNMNTRDFFAACVNGNFMPRPNKVQKLINQLCPKSTHLNLYIGLERDDKPTHYMSLVRHVESGLWHLKSTS